MAHTKDKPYRDQLVNPHSKMRGHQNDIHLRSKTADTNRDRGRTSKGGRKDRMTSGVSGGVNTFHASDLRVVRTDHSRTTKGAYKSHNYGI